MTIMIMICIQIAMKPFRNNALNFAETFFLITLNAIGLATSSEMPEKDVIQVGLVLLPALHVCLVSCWSRFYADSFGENGVPLRKQSYVELKKQEHTRRCAKAKIGKPGNDDEYVQLWKLNYFSRGKLRWGILLTDSRYALLYITIKLICIMTHNTVHFSPSLYRPIASCVFYD